MFQHQLYKKKYKGELTSLVKGTYASSGMCISQAIDENRVLIVGVLAASVTARVVPMAKDGSVTDKTPTTILDSAVYSHDFVSLALCSNDTVVMAYLKTSDMYQYLMVIKIDLSGNITFGTPVRMAAYASAPHVWALSSNKVLASYCGSSSQVYQLYTISGTTITYSSACTSNYYSTRIQVAPVSNTTAFAAVSYNSGIGYVFKLTYNLSANTISITLVYSGGTTENYNVAIGKLDSTRAIACFANDTSKILKALIVTTTGVGSEFTISNDGCHDMTMSAAGLDSNTALLQYLSRTSGVLKFYLIDVDDYTKIKSSTPITSSLSLGGSVPTDKGAFQMLGEGRSMFNLICTGLVQSMKID